MDERDRLASESIAETARRLGCSRVTAWRMRRRHGIDTERRFQSDGYGAVPQRARAKQKLARMLLPYLEGEYVTRPSVIQLYLERGSPLWLLAVDGLELEGYRLWAAGQASEGAVVALIRRARERAKEVA